MKDLNQNLLRYNQRDQLRTEIEETNKMLPFAAPEEKGGIIQRRNRTQKQLDTQSPEPLTGKEKDTLSALEKKLRAKITHNMPTEEVMRKNPAGAVDWHMRWEKANKQALKYWKNVRIQLNPDSQDRDLANIERYRPSGQTDRMRTDAQIPGLMSYGNIDPADWPFDAPQNTALEQAKRAYTEEEAANAVNAALDNIDEVVAKQAESQDEEDKPLSETDPEAHAALVSRLAKGREVLAAKRAAAKQVEEISNATPVSTMAG